VGARERNFDAERRCALSLEVVDYRLVINRRSRRIDRAFRGFAQRSKKLPTGYGGRD
jgi:hypothetical protein